MSSRDIHEATVILGRETVAEALADPIAARAFWLANPSEFRAAVRDLRAKLPDVAAAVAFADGLCHKLRLALAAAWVGNLGSEVIAELGLGDEGGT